MSTLLDLMIAKDREGLEKKLEERIPMDELEHAITAAGSKPEWLPLLLANRGAKRFLLKKVIRRWIPNGNPDAVKALLDAGVKVKEEWVPKAAAAGNGPLVRVLVEAGVDVDHAMYGGHGTPVYETEAADDGFSAMTAVIVKDDLDTLEVLLELGADPNKPTWTQRTPLQLAEAMGREAIAARLQEGGGRAVSDDDLDLFGAAKKGAVARIEALLPESTETDRDRAAQAAASEGQLEAVQAIQGAGISADALNAVLRSGCADGNDELVAFALEAGADVGAITQPVGRPALVWAAANGHAAICERLLEAGAKVDQTTDGDRFTALQEAVSHDQLEAVKVLLAAGADPDRKAGDGSSARTLAAKRPEILAALDS